MFLLLIYSLFAALHLWAAGVASMGPLLAAGLRFVVGGDDVDATLKRLGWWSVGSLVASALLGLAIGVALWSAPDGEYAAMLGRFPQKLYLYTTIEWAFTLFCYAIWLATWGRWRKRPGLHAVLAIVGATNLLYHFPPLMFVQGMLIDRPSLVAEAIVSRPAFLPLMFSPEVLVKTLHFWGAAAVATTALCVGLLARRESDQRKQTAIRIAALLGLVATAGQLGTGVGALLLSPVGATTRMLGGSPLAAMALMASVVVAVALLWQWAALVFSPHQALARQTRWLTMAVTTLFLTMSLAVRL